MPQLQAACTAVVDQTPVAVCVAANIAALAMYMLWTDSNVAFETHVSRPHSVL